MRGQYAIELNGSPFEDRFDTQTEAREYAYRALYQGRYAFIKNSFLGTVPVDKIKDTLVVTGHGRRVRIVYPDPRICVCCGHGASGKFRYPPTPGHEDLEGRPVCKLCDEGMQGLIADGNWPPGRRSPADMGEASWP